MHKLFSEMYVFRKHEKHLFMLGGQREYLELQNLHLNKIYK